MKKASIKKGVLTDFAKFTGKHMCQSLFLNKVAGLMRFPQAQVFPVNFAKRFSIAALDDCFCITRLENIRR